jgi:hypothetical protein
VTGSVLWSETPDEAGDEAEKPTAADVDDSFATRRLRRWLKGMFGGPSEPKEEPPEHDEEA